MWHSGKNVHLIHFVKKTLIKLNNLLTHMIILTTTAKKRFLDTNISTIFTAHVVYIDFISFWR